MAKTVALQRSTSQVVTIDTINNLVSPLGPSLTGAIPTTSSGLPAKIQDTTIIFRGDVYTLVVTGAGNIEVRRYDTPTNTWILSSGIYTPLFGGSQMPLCLQIDNGNLVAIWINSATTATSAAAVFFNGVAWSPRVDSKLTSYEKLILSAPSGTFAPGDTVTQGAASGLIVSFDIGTNTLIVNVTSIAAFAAGAISDTTSSATATVVSATSILDGSTGGNSIVWHRAVWFATKAGLGHFFPGRITFTASVASPRFAIGDTVSSGGTKQGIIIGIGTQGNSPTQYYLDVDQTPILGATPFNVGDTISGNANLQTINYAGALGSFNVGDTVTHTGGIAGVIREQPSPTSIIVDLTAGVFPGSGTLTDTTSGATATITGVSGTYFATAVIAAFGFGALDLGSDPSLTNPLMDQAVTQGCFSFWNDNLYFVKPDVGSGIELFVLNPIWDAPAPAPPQWSTVPTVTGITTSGTMMIGPDIGNYCLFVSKIDELCLLHSGPGGTRLAKTNAQSFPAFSDVTVDKLPASISATPNLGISIYVDNRRRLNELEWFFIKNSAITVNTTTLATWDGSASVNVLTTFNGSDFLLPAGRNGETRTFTNLQPACFITSVNTTTPPSFPGRAVISYSVRDSLSRNVDVFGEYSIDGDTWFPMTEGAGDDGVQALASSPGGTPHTFFWDAFADLDGDFTFLNLRMIARIAVTTNEAPLNSFVAVIQEEYLRPPVTRNASQYRIFARPGTGSFLTGDTVTGVTSGATGTSQFTGYMLLLSTVPSAAINVGDTVRVGNSSGTVTAVELGSSLTLTLASTLGFSVGDTVTNTVTGATGQILALTGSVASVYVLTGTWATPTGSIKDLATSSTTTYSSALTTTAVVVTPLTGVFVTGTLSDTITTATATISVADLTETIVSTVGTFAQSEFINDSRTKVLTLSSTINFNVNDNVVAGAATGTINLKTQTLTVVSTAGFNIGDVVTQGLTIGTVVNVSGSIVTVNVDVGNFAIGVITDTNTATTTNITVLTSSTITVIVGSGSFSPGSITDTTTLASSAIVSVANSSATVIAVTSGIIMTSTIPADETTDIEEFNQAMSTATRSHAQLVFPGRLSTNQTIIRFLKMTLRGTGNNPQVKVSVFVSGSGPNNQYTGTFSTFQTLPIADFELVISNTDLMNQPSAAGKRYSVVVEFDLARGEIGVVSTPFFRHE